MNYLHCLFLLHFQHRLCLRNGSPFHMVLNQIFSFRETLQMKKRVTGKNEGYSNQFAVPFEG